MAPWRSLLAALLLALGSCGPMDCYMPEDSGLSYRGLVDFAMSGRTCLRWTEQSQIAPTARNGIGNHGHCRNPDESGSTPWCFVHGAGLNEVQREPCQVEVCDDELRDFQAEADALEIYMGSHSCSACGGTTGLLELGRSLRARRALRGGGLSPDSALAAAQNISVEEVQELMQSCRREASPAVSKGNSTAQVRREERRFCGLTQVLARRCSCKPLAQAAPDATASLTIAVVRAGEGAAATGHFHTKCSTACYSTSCSSCMSCTAICQSGPYPYCKSNAPAAEQMWWGMCGATSHAQLMKGYKQCGDQPPTGCPN